MLADDLLASPTFELVLRNGEACVSAGGRRVTVSRVLRFCIVGVVVLMLYRARRFFAGFWPRWKKEPGPTAA